MSAKITTVFKVVSVHKDVDGTETLKSAWMGKQDFAIIYEPWWVKPQFGRIFAFDSLEHARGWWETTLSNQPSDWYPNKTASRIYRAEARGVKPLRRIRVSSLSRDTKFFTRFWLDGLSTVNVEPAPRGSVGCSSLRLVERVHSELPLA